MVLGLIHPYTSVTSPDTMEGRRGGGADPQSGASGKAILRHQSNRWALTADPYSIWLADLSLGLSSRFELKVSGNAAKCYLVFDSRSTLVKIVVNLGNLVTSNNSCLSLTHNVKKVTMATDKTLLYTDQYKWFSRR